MKGISILFIRHERRIESWTIGFYDQKFSHNYRFPVNKQWHTMDTYKGSSCILLRSPMSKVSIHNDRKEILGSFVTKERIIFNRRPKKKNAIRQISCWHVDKHTRPWGGLFILPWGVYEAAAYLIPVSSASLVCMNYDTIIYGLAYSSKLSRQFGAQRDRARASDFSSKN